MKLYLEEIVETKRRRLMERQEDIGQLKAAVEAMLDKNSVKEQEKNPLEKRRTFKEALQKDGLSIIGEIKKASPSKGLIKAEFDPLALGQVYEGCVDAVSILTEEDYFLGQDTYLEEVSHHIVLPTLCKDFIIDASQIYRAKLLGAKAVLLIVHILTDEQLQQLYELATSIGLDVLVETHNKDEIQRALQVGVEIIGINNRNLETFVTTIDTTLELAPLVPETCIRISESGILSEADVSRLASVQLDGILVGENFMRSSDMVQTAAALKAAYRRG